MNNININTVASLFFLCAVLHTFATSLFAKWSKSFPEGSFFENLLHYFAEVEVVFGLWAFSFVAYLAATKSLDDAVQYIGTVNFTEAMFVFVIMAISATKPIMNYCEWLVLIISQIFPKKWQSSIYFFMALTVGPLMGGFITEPAAMVVTALLLKNIIFDSQSSTKLRYTTLATLLVNISIGGTLTHFAAPPVIMVAQKWNWGFKFMFEHFGWKSILIILVNTSILFSLNFKELLKKSITTSNFKRPPIWMFLSHVFFMVLVVKYHGNSAFFVPLFLFFIGWTDVTKEHQENLKLKEALLVGFFLGGLVTLGQLQRWWIEPIVTMLNPLQLFLGTTVLTALTDNAALTYLGTLIPNLNDQAKYALVAGAVSGGGLTVIANAPNPIAVGLLKENFENSSINPLKLLLAAIIPTSMACLGFWLL